MVLKVIQVFATLNEHMSYKFVIHLIYKKAIIQNDETAELS